MSSPAIQTAATSAAQSSSPATLAFTTQNTTAGSLLCGIVRYNSTGTLGAISDNQNSGNYTVVSLGTNGAVTSAFFYKLNTTGGSKPTISCVLTGTVAGVVIAIAEYPLSAAASLRTSNTGTATGTNPTTAAVSPAVGDLLIAAFGSTGGWTTSSLSAGTCGASATLHPGGTVSGVTTFASLEDGVANSASSQTASLTFGASSAYMTGLFAFEQSVVATSTFSPVAGTYSGTQSVTLINANSGLAGFAQYYTTDGSTPTTGSTLYTGAISVSTSQTIKVLAVATGWANSAIASAAYVINSAGGGAGSGLLRLLGVN